MTTEVAKTEAQKQEIRDLCMEIIGLCYESKPDPIKILNRSMTLANANAALAREWSATIAEKLCCAAAGYPGACCAWEAAQKAIAARIRES